MTARGEALAREPFELLLRSPRGQRRHRLLSPEHVTGFVRDQDHAGASNLILRLGSLYGPAAHVAGPTSAPMRLVDTAGDRETVLIEPDT